MLPDLGEEFALLFPGAKLFLPTNSDIMKVGGQTPSEDSQVSLTPPEVVFLQSTDSSTDQSITSYVISMLALVLQHFDSTDPFLWDQHFWTYFNALERYAQEIAALLYKKKKGIHEKNDPERPTLCAGTTEWWIGLYFFAHIKK